MLPLFGSGNLIRTDDTPGMNRMLYQLSYAAIYDPPPKQQNDYIRFCTVCQVFSCIFSFFRPPAETGGRKRNEGRRLRLLAALDHVHCNGKDDQSAGDDVEDVVVDLEGLAGVLDDDHQERADKRAGDRAAAASQRSAADNCRRDGVHVVAVAGVRHGAEDTAGEHDGSDAIDKAGEGVNKVEGLADLDAAQAGDLDAGADDEQVAAEDGVAQDQEGNDCHDDPDAGQDRQDAEDVIVADGVKELDERCAVRLKE